MAAEEGKIDFVKFLLEKKANTKIMNNANKAASDLAKEKGNKEIAQLIDPNGGSCQII